MKTQDIKKLKQALKALEKAQSVIADVVDKMFSNDDDAYKATELDCISEQLANQLEFLTKFIDASDD